MEYMLLIYGDPVAWEAMPEPERDEVLRLHAALLEELRRSGEFLGGAGLADPERTVTVRDGLPTTEGPFAPAGEQMSAFYLVECETPERARALAERILDAHVPAVEMRPIHTLESGSDREHG